MKHLFKKYKDGMNQFLEVEDKHKLKALLKEEITDDD